MRDRYSSRPPGHNRYTTQQVGVFFGGIAIGLIVGIATGEIVTWMMAGVVLGAIFLAILSLRPK